ncbi:MAG: hypothetical protein RIR79_1904 [Pseudomonadota bacterium]|jgi:hypothetical protein
MKLFLLAAVALCSVTGAVAQQQPSTTATTIPTTNSTSTSTSTSNAISRTLNEENNWYFSWGYSRQQYAPSDIHISQPSLGNDFTVHQVGGADFPATPQQTWDSIINFDLTTPQENVRIGKFLNPEKTFAVELSIDHSKYNTNLNQTARVSGVINNQPYNQNMVLSPENFDYALHNGLNHIMVNAVWFHHLLGPEKQEGELELISRAGAGILLPHAQNVILGNANQVGPKGTNICCFSKQDWWQVNGWTAGVEVGFRYRFYKSVFVELTSKLAYGSLRGVPVYQGSADHTLWMSEQVLSLGFLF